MSHASFADELAKWGPQADYPAPPRAEAEAYCRRLARSHYENFTAASWLLPKQQRQHFCNVYAYCRWADDLADETGDRAKALELLDWWEEQLARLWGPGIGDQGPEKGEPGEGKREKENGNTNLKSEIRNLKSAAPRHPVFVALGETVREFELPREPFHDLLTAFRQDQVKSRYESLDELLEYCRYSANPVGRIVLRLSGAYSEENALLSDKICTGLQLANFWQDIGRDWQRGRVYLPQELCRHFDYHEQSPQWGKTTPPLCRMLSIEVQRAERLIQEGRKLVPRLQPPLRWQVEAFAQGGLAVLAAIRRQNYDVWSRRPVVGRLQKIRILAGAWWRGAAA